MIGVPRSWNSHPEVAYAGELPRASVPLYLQAADIFVLPTTNEGMCNALLEALSVGLPVVTSDLPFNREVLSQHEGILIDPLDISGISSAILRLREEANLREKLGKISITVASKFSLALRVKGAEKFLAQNNQA